jgi:hypothetical protein
MTVTRKGRIKGVKRLSARRPKEHFTEPAEKHFIEPAEKHFTGLLTPRGGDPCERKDNCLPWENAPLRAAEAAPTWRPAARPYCCPDCGGRDFWQLPGGRWLCCKCRPNPAGDPWPVAQPKPVTERTQPTQAAAAEAGSGRPVDLTKQGHTEQPVKAGGLLVTFNPDIAVAALQRQAEITYLQKGRVITSRVSYAPAWRAWAIARAAAAAAGTSGDVAIALFYQAARKAGIPRRSIEHGINQARELGWLRKVKGKDRPNRFVIAGQKNLALAMNTRPNGKQVTYIDTANLAGAGWRAFLFGTWEESHNRQAKPESVILKKLKNGESETKILPAQPKQLRPMSRTREEELTTVFNPVLGKAIKIDRFRMARYDRQAGVRREKNWNMTGRPADELPMFKENGKPAVVINGEVAIRKPDARELPGVKVVSFGRGRNILQALDKRGASINSLLFSDGALCVNLRSVKKVFCQTEREAESLAKRLAKNDRPPQDIFIPAGHTSAGGRKWRQYLYL